MGAVGLVLAILFAVCFFGAHNTFHRRSGINLRCGKTAEDVAREILQSRVTSDITVMRSCDDVFTDNYNHKTAELSLSESVYRRESASAIAVAAQVTGHALQYADGACGAGTAPKPASGTFIFRIITDAVTPFARFVSNAGFALMFITTVSGEKYRLFFVSKAAYILAAVLLFQLVTLPVELDASSRAFKILCDEYLADDEISAVRTVMFAACFSYIASSLSQFKNAVSSLLSLLKDFGILLWELINKYNPK